MSRLPSYVQKRGKISGQRAAAVYLPTVTNRQHKSPRTYQPPRVRRYALLADQLDNVYAVATVALTKILVDEVLEKHDELDAAAAATLLSRSAGISNCDRAFSPQEGSRHAAARHRTPDLAAPFSGRGCRK